MTLNDQLEACKAHFLKREREIMDRCSKMVADAGRSKLKYDEKLETLDKVFHHMEYDGVRRVLSIQEDRLALLGIKTVQGKVQL